MTPHQHEEWLAWCIRRMLEGKLEGLSSFKGAFSQIEDGDTMAYRAVLVMRHDNVRCIYCGTDLAGVGVPGGQLHYKEFVLAHTEPCKKAFISAHPLEHLAVLDM